MPLNGGEQAKLTVALIYWKKVPVHGPRCLKAMERPPISAMNKS